MRFKITYTEHRQVTTTADGTYVIGVLDEYAKQIHPAEKLRRAAHALHALAKGKETFDFGIIADALSARRFNAPAGFTVDERDNTTSDYTVEEAE